MKIIHFNKISQFILFSVLLISCNISKDKNETIISSPLIKIDTLSVNINENYLQNYTALRNRIYNDQLYAYNIHQHTIDIFDFATQNFISQIKLKREGADGIPNINSFIIANGLIIAQNESNYTIIDQNGKIVKKISKETLTNNLNDKDYLLDAPNNISISNFEDMTYDSNEKKLIVPISTLDPHKLKDKYCLANIDINTEKISFYPITYPDKLNNEYYGKLSRPNSLTIKDQIIYNFSYSSNIYLFDKNSQTTTLYNITSDFTKNNSEQLDKNANIKKQLDHYFHSLYFHGIQYDHYRNIFYRLHTNKSSDVSVFNNKETYLTIISANFEKIAEIKLPTNLYPIFNITEKGLLFQFMSGLYEDKYSYMIITCPYIMPVKKTDKLKIKDTISTIEKPKTKDTISTIEKSKTHSSYEIITTHNIKSFITKNLIYPTAELENNIEGAVFVILNSDSSGAILSCKISDIATTTDNKALRDEAIRIAKLIKRVEPNIIFSFHVNFNKKEYLSQKNSN